MTIWQQSVTIYTDVRTGGQNGRIRRKGIVANMATALNTTTDYLICGKEGTDSFEDTYRLVARGSSGMSLDQKMKLIKELTKNE